MAQLIVVGVDGSGQGEHAAAPACRVAAGTGAEVHAVFVSHDPWDTLVSYAREVDVATLVAGSGGRGDPASPVLGSTGRRVAHDVHSGGLIARAGEAS